MRNLLCRPLTGLIVLTLGLATTGWAQDDDAVYGEYLLPPETRLMFSISSVPDLVEQVSGTETGKMFSDPGLQPIIGEIKSKLEEVSKELSEKAGITLEDLYDLAQGEITFAIVEKPTRKLNAVFMFEYGDSQATVDKLLEKLDTALKANADHSTKTIADVEVQIFEFPKTDQNPYNKLAYFTSEGYFVAASDVAALEAVLTRWDGDSTQTLGEAEVFSYIFEKCSTEDEEPAIKWYVDLIGLIKSGVSTVQGEMPQAGMVLGFLPILGLDGLKGMGGGINVGVGDFETVNKAFIYVEQPPAGLLGAFQFPTTSQTPPAWVSADASMYAGMNWNVMEAYLSIESLVDSFQGPGALARLVDMVATSDDGPMIHPKKDVIDNLTGEIHISTLAPEAAEDDEEAAPPTPLATFAVGLKSASVMKDTLAKAADSDGFPGRTREFEGQTLYEIPMDGEQNMTVGVVGDYLYITSKVELLEEIIRGKFTDSLVDSEDWKDLTAHFPAKTSMIGFQQQDQSAKTAYEMAKNQAAGEIEGFDLSKLPEFEVLQKYFKPTGSYTVPDEKGVLFVGFSLSDE
ncbi:hypothetical protein GC163_19240 [bacterium]|nr:hypothetical protein [bacterium]